MTDYEAETPSTKDLQAFGGLSKEEYARIHAPDAPKWFVDEWEDENFDNNAYFEHFEIPDEFCKYGIPELKIKIKPLGRITLHKAWLDYFVSVTVD